MKRLYYSLLLVVLISSCRRETASLTSAERAGISDSIRLTLNKYYRDIKKEGLMAEFAYLDSSAEFYWVPPGFSASIPYDSVASVLRKTAPLYTSINNTWETLNIRPLNREFATYTGRLHSSMTDTSGKVTACKLIETGVLIKRRDGWKLLSGQTSMIR